MEKIYNRQIKFQEQMNTTYEVQYLALVAELGEFVDSLGFADWKEDARDEENMIVEAMDICIFAMNCNHYLGKDFTQPEAHPWSYNRDFPVVQEIINLISQRHFLEIVELLFHVYPKVKNKIIGKQALNKFRQDNGYKDGTYKKIWDSSEDNVFMLSTLENTKISFDAIYAALAIEYKKYI